RQPRAVTDRDRRTLAPGVPRRRCGAVCSGRRRRSVGIQPPRSLLRSDSSVSATGETVTTIALSSVSGLGARGGGSRYLHQCREPYLCTAAPCCPAPSRPARGEAVAERPLSACETRASVGVARTEHARADTTGDVQIRSDTCELCNRNALGTRAAL